MDYTCFVGCDKTCIRREKRKMDTLFNEFLEENEDCEKVVLGTELVKAANTAPISYLLKAARAMGCHDYAIKYYYYPNSKTFYKNEGAVRKTCRKKLQDKATASWQIDRFIQVLEDYGYQFQYTYIN